MDKVSEYQKRISDQTEVIKDLVDAAGYEAVRLAKYLGDIGNDTEMQKSFDEDAELIYKAIDTLNSYWRELVNLS